MNDNIYNQKMKSLAKSSYGAGELSPRENVVRLDNPLCGDRVMLTADVKEGRIESVIHSVKGCLLCRAAASAIGAMACGTRVQAMVQVCRHMAAMLKGDTTCEPFRGWEVLAVFEPVKAHRDRHGCVLLPFQAVEMALNNFEPSQAYA